MHFSTSIAIVTALLTGQALAVCGGGLPAHSRYRVIGPCEVTHTGSFLFQNIEFQKGYECGERPDQIVLDDSGFILTSAQTDLYIRVNCSPSDQHIYYCTANDQAQFSNPCTGGSKGLTIDRISVP